MQTEILIPVSTSVTLILLYYIFISVSFVWLETRILSLTFLSVMTLRKKRRKMYGRRSRKKLVLSFVYCLRVESRGRLLPLVHGRLRRVCLVSSLLPPKNNIQKNSFFFFFSKRFSFSLLPPHPPSTTVYVY